MDDFEKLEYEQVSEDWRHRDSLTWQIPSVLIVVGGVLVAEALKLPPFTPSWIKSALLFFAMFFATSLTVALWQNLALQRINRKTIETLYPKTQRFGFLKFGSTLLLLVCIAISLFLAVLCGLSIFSKL